MQALHTLRRCLVAKVNMYLDKCHLSLPKVLQLQSLLFSLYLSPSLSLSFSPSVFVHFNCLPHTQLILLIEIAVATRLIGSYSSLWPASPNGVRASPDAGTVPGRISCTPKWQVASGVQMNATGRNSNNENGIRNV